MEAAESTGQPNGQELVDRSLLILYGTESGHSQEIAQEISDGAERLRFRTTVEQMNDVSLKDLVQYSFTVFVISTTGQGDMPSNATAFWKSLLRKKLPPTCLSQLQFTIFGLGDSSYPKFNWAARKLQKRLLQLGALELHPTGEGDERHDNGIDTIYLPWLQGLITKLLTNCPLPQDTLPIPDEDLLPPKYPIRVEEMDEEKSSIKHARWDANLEKNAALSHIEHPKSDTQQQDDEDLRRNDLGGFGQYAREGGTISDRLTIGGVVNPDKDNILKDHPHKYDLRQTAPDKTDLPPREFLPIPGTWESTLIEIDRITPKDHWQDVRLLKIEMLKSGWNDDPLPHLQPGDVINIYPKNFPADAQTLIDIMDWKSIADKKVIWNSGSARSRPRNLYPIEDATFRDILLHNLDFNSIPNRTFLKQLRRHTNIDLEKERLLELTQEANTQEFYDYTSRPRRTILEVLQDFPGVKIPMEYALEIFPIIRPRAFSIANSPKGHQSDDPESRIVEILVALVEYKTIIRKPRQGLCSRYIKELCSGACLAVGHNRTNPPPSGKLNARRPLIAIATGTGIAPIRSLIQERTLWIPTMGPTLLFFGCRNKDADYYFKEEWEDQEALEVITAFSRDPINPADQVSLDPYTEQERDVLKPGIVLGNEAAPIGPQNTPWMRSFDYDRGKMYVQHQIRRHARRVCALLSTGLETGHRPIVMICGNAGRMPVSVRHALEDAMVIGGFAKDNDVAKRLLQDMVWMETW